MSFDSVQVHAENLSKVFHLYTRPGDRLKQMLWGGRRHYGRAFEALKDVSFQLHRGEVLGLIGRNGAGKSTLLQMICGTLTPTAGRVQVKGRVAALLELGAGFNQDFTGRENIYLNGAVLGLTREEIDQRYDEIVEFSGIRSFIDQPVKTYSSGMYVRLAFSIATSIDPDILVIDEALSVGDGEFSRKSFDRIMNLKKRGATILFCSHSLYQIEAMCDQAIWLDEGKQKMLGRPAEVVLAYQEGLASQAESAARFSGTDRPGPDRKAVTSTGVASLQSIVMDCDGQQGRELRAMSGSSVLSFEVQFASDPALPAPALAVSIDNAELRLVTSAISLEQGAIERDAQGNGRVLITFPNLPLLKGRYSFSFYLTCENGIHFYDLILHGFYVMVDQESLEQGVFRIPREWSISAV